MAVTEDIAAVMTKILEHGEEYVVSFEGRSQYSGISGGGVSACGLAALNCARVILGKEKEGTTSVALLQAMMKRETLEAILEICLQWTSAAHLDVDEIFKAPIFDKTLNSVWSVYDKPSLKGFHTLLERLQETNGSASVVITRPPEIISVLKISAEAKDVFVIFDSHPRHKHPKGAAFIFNTSLDATALYLGELLQYDPGLLADRAMQWQAQLLANFCAQAFVSKQTLVGPSDLMEAVIDSSLEVLILKAELADLKRQNRFLQDDKERLTKETERLEGEVDDLEIAVSQERQIARAASFTPHTVPGAWDSHWDPPKAGPSTLKGGTGIKASQTSVRPAAQEVKLASKPTTSPQIVSTQSKRKLVMHTSEEVDDDDYVFATRIQFEWMETSNPDDKASTKLAMETQRQFEDEFVEYDESARLAAETQRLFEEEDERLRVEFMALQAEVPPTFECGICLEEQSEFVIARISPCDHAFCRDCVRGYIRSKLGDHRFPILCPVCVTERDTVDPGTITTALAQQIGLSEVEYATFTELELAAFSVLLHCRRCQQAVFVDRPEYDASAIIVCPLPGCNNVWCKTCSQAVELGGPQHSCDGSNELNHLMSQKGWKHCPGCKTPTEKVDGCNHMTCTSPGCNTHFCYVCGATIVRSVMRQEIQRGVSAHYTRCRMIDDIVGVRVPRRR